MRLITLLILFSGVSVAAAQSPGDRVLGRWSADGLWYPARVQSAGPEGIRLAFDDGDVALVKRGETRAIHWSAGSVLQCNWKNQGKYFQGRIARKDGETIEFRYDDGETETMTISRCRSS